MDLKLEQIFDKFGVKEVTRTDKSKSAYVLTKEQLDALHAAGISPAPEVPAKPFHIRLLLDPRSSVEATYYHSKRADPKRSEEPRLGTEFIRSWLDVGDIVVVGNIGRQIFAAKINTGADSLQIAHAVASAASAANRGELIDKASQIKGIPARRKETRTGYDRNPLVVAGAIARSGGRCEMPDCDAKLFRRDDGTVYLEVHHIQPLSEGGEDTLANAAALCPRCHRELHFGVERLELRGILRNSVPTDN